MAFDETNCRCQPPLAQQAVYAFMTLAQYFAASMAAYFSSGLRLESCNDKRQWDSVLLCNRSHPSTKQDSVLQYDHHVRLCSGDRLLAAECLSSQGLYSDQLVVLLSEVLHDTHDTPMSIERWTYNMVLSKPKGSTGGVESALTERPAKGRNSCAIWTTVERKAAMELALVTIWRPPHAIPVQQSQSGSQHVDTSVTARSTTHYASVTARHKTHQASVSQH